jgi:GDP-D-mannose dehydratase
MKKALITEITGQDGSYLAEYLLTEVTCTGLALRENIHQQS